MEKPNPNDPTMVDVYDDATGEYVTTLPAPQDPARGFEPMGDAPPELASSPVINSATTPAAPSKTDLFANADDSQAHAAPEAPAAKASLTPGSADGLHFDVEGTPDESEDPGMIPGSPGGMQVSQEQSTGLNPERAASLIGEVEGAADEERSAVLDEALAREIQLAESEKEQARLEAEVKAKQAEQALEVKLNMDRRKKVEERFAQVEAQEPDRNRAFPTGWNKVAVFIGAIAGGMLKGLQGGKNQVLDSLMSMLDEDVRQQRLTQSEQLRGLTRELGSVDAAEDLLRAKQKEVVLKETEARLMGTANKVAPAQIDAFRKRMNAEITRHKVDAISKLDRDLTIQEVNTPGTASQPFNAESFRAEELNKYAAANGLKPKDAHTQWNAWSKGFKDRATLRSGLQTANGLIAKFEASNDVAGLGPMAKFIPSSINAKDAVAVRQVLGSVTAQYLKAISGAAVTEQEFARTIENLQGAGDYDSVKRGLGILGQAIKSEDEEDQVQNPAFWRIRGSIQQLSRGGDVKKQAGRAQQEGQVGDSVVIPHTSRIAHEHNNPGNLTFQGQRGATRGEPKEGGGYWAHFEDVNGGMRALAHQVQIDSDRNLNLRQFAEKYAPPKENKTEAWIAKFKAMMKRTSNLDVDDQTPLSEISPGRAAYVIAAIESSSRPGK